MIKRTSVFILLATCCALAQIPGRSPKVVAAPIAKVTVTQGGKGKVEMVFRVMPGYHINSHQPSSDLYIPTTLTFDAPTDISLAGMKYPEGELLSLPFDPDTKLSVYTGDITVTGMVMAAKSAPRGTYRVHGSLRYQACDNRSCYPPSTVPIAFDVTVSKPAASKTPHANPAQSPHIHN